jgi:hypothetical protein
VQFYIVKLFDKDGVEFSSSPVQMTREEAQSAVEFTVSTVDKYVRYELVELTREEAKEILFNETGVVNNDI